MKRAVMSTCRDAGDRSKKSCACGGHQGKRGRPKKVPWKGRSGRRARVIKTGGGQ